MRESPPKGCKDVMENWRLLSRRNKKRLRISIDTVEVDADQQDSN